MAGATQDRRSPGSNQGKKHFQLAIGRDFGRVEEVEAKTRGFLARIVALAAVAGVGITGGYSLITNNFMAVVTVWAIAGPIIGAVVSHDFGPRRNDSI